MKKRKKQSNILNQIEAAAFIGTLLSASAMDSVSIVIPAIGCFASSLVMLFAQNLQRGGHNVY